MGKKFYVFMKWLCIFLSVYFLFNSYNYFNDGSIKWGLINFIIFLFPFVCSVDHHRNIKRIKHLEDMGYYCE